MHEVEAKGILSAQNGMNIVIPGTSAKCRANHCSGYSGWLFLSETGKAIHYLEKCIWQH